MEYLVMLVVALVVIAFSLGFYYKYQISPVSRDSEKVVVEIKNGSIYSIGDTLYENDLIRSKFIFKLYVKYLASLENKESAMRFSEFARVRYNLTESDLPILFEQYEILAKEMIKRKKAGNGFTFYHYMLDLTHGPCIYKRISGCGSGTEYMAVTPTGDLYPCHQFVGDTKYLLGNLWDGVTNKEIQNEFKLCNAYARPECNDCWAKLYCSGGCAANSYHASGKITGIYEYGCELFKKRIECAVMIQVAENYDK